MAPQQTISTGLMTVLGVIETFIDTAQKLHVCQS
jgi:hypothetical protein